MKRLVLASALTLIAMVGTAPAQTPTPAGLPASTRLAMPGDQHRWLEPLVGEWTVEMLVYPGPGAAPLVSQGLRARREWTLGGRYLREELRGNVMGNASARDAILGFNRLDNRFELVTVDTFEPGQMFYAGRDEPAPTRFSLHGESTEAGMGPEPTGRRRDLRFEFEVTGPDANVQRIFVRYPGSAEFLFVEQRFTRAR